MLHYSVDKTAVVGFVDGIMQVFDKDLRSITITIPEKSEDCFVLIVTSSSSVDAVKEWTHNGYGWPQIT